MVMFNSYINVYKRVSFEKSLMNTSLVGGDCNHGILRLSIIIGNVIISTDELHHFSELKPPTS